MQQLNKRVSRSGLATNSSPPHDMSKEASSTSPKDQKDARMHCNIQDVWSLLISIQEQVRQQNEHIMRQNCEIQALTLKNQELEYNVKMQEMKMQQQECIIKELQSKMSEYEAIKAQGNVSTMQVCSQPSEGGFPTWAQVVRSENASGNAPDNMNMSHEGPTEYKEREQRSRNIVIRGMHEPDGESTLSLNVAVTNFLADHLGMQDAGVYGAHRVGKKRPDASRGVVCTMLDERKRIIILENACFYLKGTEYYVTEDRTPTQQAERRKAYEERIRGKNPPVLPVST